MKVYEAISRCDALNPNTVAFADKVKMLSQLDGLIKSETYSNYKFNDTESDADIAELVDSFDSGYNPDAQTQAESDMLLVPFPYDDIYVNYLIAQVYLTLGEHNKYNDYINIFNSEMDTFDRYWSRTHKPMIPQKMNYF